MWPEQLKDLFPELKDLTVTYSMGDVDRPDTQKTWTGDAFAQRVRVTCHDCNHGWLNDLENAGFVGSICCTSGGGSRSSDARVSVATYRLQVECAPTARLVVRAAD